MEIFRHDSGITVYLPCLIILYICSFVTVFHILLNMKDETERAKLWLLFVLSFPGLGVLLYLCCGLNRRDTLGHRVKHIGGQMETAQDPALQNLLAKRNMDISKFHAKDAAAEPYRIMLDRQFPTQPPLTGNSAELLCDGNGAYPAMLQAINQAKNSIHMQSFIIANDKIGHILFNAMEKRAKEGVQVRVIYDSFGSFGAMTGHFFRRYSNKTPNMEIRAFSRTVFLAPWLNQLRNHRKLLIVDGKTAFLGGLNISADNFRFKKKKAAIHDLHCRLTGPAVSELQNIFLRDWCIARRCSVAEAFRPEHFPTPEATGNNTVRVIASGHGYDFQGSERCFYTATATAKKSLWICTPYFVPDSDFVTALRLAARRGVDVRILLPKHNNHWFMRMASQNLYEPLCQDGIRILERKGIFSHAKVMLVDGIWCMFGSSNCDVRSFRLNYELDLAITGGDFIEQLHLQLIQEMNQAEEIHLADIAAQSAMHRLAQSFCALFTPIL